MEPLPPTPADPGQLVLLTSVRHEVEGHAIAASLAEAGVQASVFGASASGLGWEGGYNNTVRVMVRRADLAAAQQWMSARAAAARAIDWDRVDVGEPEGDVSVPSRGRSPGLRRVRRVGLSLLNGAMLLGAMGQSFIVPAVVVTVLLVAAAWNEPPAPTPPPHSRA